MSVEQTSQLIQLILNSVLMVIACGIVLSGLLVRHTVIKERLRSLHRDYVELLGQGGSMGDYPEGGATSQRLFQLRVQLHGWRYHQHLSQRTLVILAYALCGFVVSTLTLALRTVWFWNGLIPIALILFIGALGLLLLGVGLMVLDFHITDRSLVEEIRWVLSLGKDSRIEGKSKLQGRTIPRSTVHRVLPGEPQGSPKVGIN